MSKPEPITDAELAEMTARCNGARADLPRCIAEIERQRLDYGLLSDDYSQLQEDNKRQRAEVERLKAAARAPANMGDNILDNSAGGAR